MDPNKVDSVVNWKTPTNRDSLRGALGPVVYLADDVPNIRIPMGVLSAPTSDTVPFCWSFTEQRAFEDVKRLVEGARAHRRLPIDYSQDAPQIWMTTDGSASGISGLIRQRARMGKSKGSSVLLSEIKPSATELPCARNRDVGWG